MVTETKEKKPEDDKPQSMAEQLIAIESGQGALEDSIEQMAGEDLAAATGLETSRQFEEDMQKELKAVAPDVIGGPKLQMVDAINTAFDVGIKKYSEALNSKEAQRAKTMGPLGDIIAAAGVLFGVPALMVGGQKLGQSARGTLNRITATSGKFMNTVLAETLSGQYKDPTGGMGARTGQQIVSGTFDTWRENKLSQGIDPTEAEKQALLAHPLVQEAGMGTMIKSQFNTIKQMKQDPKAGAVEKGLTMAEKMGMEKLDAIALSIEDEPDVLNEIARLKEERGEAQARTYLWEELNRRGGATVGQAPDDAWEATISGLLGTAAPIQDFSETQKKFRRSEKARLQIPTDATAFAVTQMGISMGDLDMPAEITRREIQVVPFLAHIGTRKGTRMELINRFIESLGEDSVAIPTETGTDVRIPTKMKGMRKEIKEALKAIDERRFVYTGSAPSTHLAPTMGKAIGVARIDKSPETMIRIFNEELRKNATRDQIKAAFVAAYKDPTRFTEEFRRYLRERGLEVMRS